MNAHPLVAGLLLDKGPQAGESNYFTQWFAHPAKTCNGDNSPCGSMDGPGKCINGACILGSEWFRELLPPLHRDMVAGESSVAYLTSETAPSNVLVQVGKTPKFIALFREPVDRIQVICGAVQRGVPGFDTNLRCPLPFRAHPPSRCSLNSSCECV